jgi:hypothetical protein
VRGARNGIHADGFISAMTLELCLCVMGLGGPAKNVLDWLGYTSQPTCEELRAVITSLISEAIVTCNGEIACPYPASDSLGMLLRALLCYCKQDRQHLEVGSLSPLFTETAPVHSRA